MLKRDFLVMSAILAVICWGVVAFPLGAQATPTLILNDYNGNIVTIADNTPLDSSPTLGVVTYNGAVGPNWIINIVTGISQSPFARIDLNSINVSIGSGSGILNLSIMFSDTGFSQPPSLVFPSVSMVGITDCGSPTFYSVENEAWFDNNNALFGMGTRIGGLNSFWSPFSWSFSGGDYPIGTFSLTDMVLIRHNLNGWNTTSFSSIVRGVPLPPSVFLLGSGLLGLVGWRRFRKV